MLDADEAVAVRTTLTFKGKDLGSQNLTFDSVT